MIFRTASPMISKSLSIALFKIISFLKCFEVIFRSQLYRINLRNDRLNIKEVFQQSRLRKVQFWSD